MSNFCDRQIVCPSVSADVLGALVRLAHVSCPPEVFVEEFGQAFGIAVSESRGSRFCSPDDLHHRAHAHQRATKKQPTPHALSPAQARIAVSGRLGAPARLRASRQPANDEASLGPETPSGMPFTSSRVWSTTPSKGNALMTLDEAVAAVEATLESAHLRVDRRRAQEDASSYLLLVLDTSGGKLDEGQVNNGPRLVAKRTGEIERLTVPEALARSKGMRLVRSRTSSAMARKTS